MRAAPTAGDTFPAIHTADIQYAKDSNTQTGTQKCRSVDSRKIPKRTFATLNTVITSWVLTNGLMHESAGESEVECRVAFTTMSFGRKKVELSKEALLLSASKLKRTAMSVALGESETTPTDTTRCATPSSVVNSKTTLHFATRILLCMVGREARYFVESQESGIRDQVKQRRPTQRVKLLHPTT